MNFVSTWPGERLSGKPTLNRVGGSIRMFGNMNRAKPSSHIKFTAANDVKPTARDEPNSAPAAAARKVLRVVSSPAGTTAALALAYSGFAGIGGTSSLFFAGAGAGAAFAAASAFVIGPGFAVFLAAARMLAVSFGAAAASFAAAGL